MGAEPPTNKNTVKQINFNPNVTVELIPPKWEDHTQWRTHVKFTNTLFSRNGQGKLRNGKRHPKRKRWRFLQANVTAWATGGAALLSDDYADVMCIQEHHCTGQQLPGARQHGWRSIVTPACPTAAGGTSGGVAILAKKHIPLSAVSDTTPFDGIRDPEKFAGRFVAALVGAGPSRSTVVVSTYFWSGEGWSTRNNELAALTSAWLHSLGRPYVWASDWNNTPEEVLASGLFNGTKCAIFAPGSPTLRFADREIDFYVVSSNIKSTIASCHSIDTAITPHRAVCLTFDGNAPQAAWKLSRPGKIPTALPVGPAEDPKVDWGVQSIAAESITTTQQVDACIKAWYQGATDEITAKLHAPAGEYGARGEEVSVTFHTERAPACRDYAKGPAGLQAARELVADLRELAYLKIAHIRNRTDQRLYAIFGICAKWSSQNKINGAKMHLSGEQIRYIRQLRTLDAQTVRVVAHEVELTVKNVARQWCQQRTVNWRNWLREAASGSGRTAYKFLKATPVFRLDPVTNGEPQSNPAQVASLAEVYGNLWDTTAFEQISGSGATLVVGGPPSLDRPSATLGQSPGHTRSSLASEGTVSIPGMETGSLMVQ